MVQLHNFLDISCIVSFLESRCIEGNCGLVNFIVIVALELKQFSIIQKDWQQPVLPVQRASQTTSASQILCTTYCTIYIYYCTKCILHLTSLHSECYGAQFAVV